VPEDVGTYAVHHVEESPSKRCTRWRHCHVWVEGEHIPPAHRHHLHRSRTERTEEPQWQSRERHDRGENFLRAICDPDQLDHSDALSCTEGEVVQLLLSAAAGPLTSTWSLSISAPGYEGLTGVQVTLSLEHGDAIGSMFLTNELGIALLPAVQ
jgi:hypothetical protein